MRKFLARLALVLAFLTPAALIAPVGQAVTPQQDILLLSVKTNKARASSGKILQTDGTSKILLVGGGNLLKVN